MTLNVKLTAERGILLCGLMQPLMGAPSRGVVDVAMTGTDDVTIYKGQILHPDGLFGGGRRTAFDRPFVVREDTLISLATTTAVEIDSWLGGAVQNLATGTKLTFFPPVGGIEPTATVNATFTGGANFPADTLKLNSTVWYQRTKPDAPIPDELVRAAVANSPCALITWAGSKTIDPSGSSRTTREDSWILTLISTRADAHHLREYEVITLADVVEQLIMDRSTIRNMVVSQPGIAVTGRAPIIVDAGKTAVAINFTTRTGLVGLAVSDPGNTQLDLAITEWVKSSLRITTCADETGTHPGTLDVVKEGIYPQ